MILALLCAAISPIYPPPTILMPMSDAFSLTIDATTSVIAIRPVFTMLASTYTGSVTFFGIFTQGGLNPNEGDGI